MTLQPIPSECPYIRGDFFFLFYQCINTYHYLYLRILSAMVVELRLGEAFT
jgi:hypothetical protein